MRQYSLNIDTVGVCNLSCPSCPQGNDSQRMPKGILDPLLLLSILEKASKECSLVDVSLFNWTEPLLHPELGRLISIANGYSKSVISTNLNRRKGIEEMCAARPGAIRVSCSGFTNPVYQRTHRGGDVEVVKENMKLVAKLIHKECDLSINWHRYKHNLADEIQMKSFGESLGYRFSPVDAYVMPLEKVLAGTPSEVEELLITPTEVKLAQALSNRAHACTLQLRTLTLNHLGEVQLCCAVYDPLAFNLGKFVDMPIEEIQHKKDNHWYCVGCSGRGGHAYALMIHDKKPSKLADMGMEFYVEHGYKFIPHKVAIAVRNFFKK